MNKFNEKVNEILNEWDTHPRTYLDIRGQKNIPEQKLYKLGSEYKKLHKDYNKAYKDKKKQDKIGNRMDEIKDVVYPYLDDTDDFEAFYLACD